MVEPVDVANTDKAPQTSIGVLHNDATIEEGGVVVELWKPATQPTLNTPLTGGGGVYAAFLGSNPRDAMYFCTFEREPVDPNHPHFLLLEGLVNPALINRKIYWADIGPGDTVVMSNVGTKSAWHRFDTDLSKGRRLPVITILKDAAPDIFDIPDGGGEIKVHRPDRGFDIEKAQTSITDDLSVK